VTDFGVDDLVNRIRMYMSLNAPTARNLKSYTDWVINGKPLSFEETLFLRRKEDFVALSDLRESGWLDRAVEDSLMWLLPKRVVKVPNISFLFLTSSPRTTG